MRMDQSNSSLTAAYVVNNVAEDEIARILYLVGILLTNLNTWECTLLTRLCCCDYANSMAMRGSHDRSQEPYVGIGRRKGASAQQLSWPTSCDVALRREEALSMPATGSILLRERSKLFASSSMMRYASYISLAFSNAILIRPATQIKQLQQALAGAESMLAPGGRLAVISFHSLEDREVKDFLDHCVGRKRKGRDRNALDRLLSDEKAERAEGTEGRGEEGDDGPGTDESGLFLPSFRLVRMGPGGKWIAPSEDETERNVRARSAKLRVAERTQFPPHYSSSVFTGGE